MGMSSANALMDINDAQRDNVFPYCKTVRDSKTNFRFGDGEAGQSVFKAVQPTPKTSPLRGENIELQIMDQPNNMTPPLIGMDYWKRKRP